MCLAVPPIVIRCGCRSMAEIPAIPLRQQRAAGQQPDDVTCIDAHGLRQRYLSDARLFGWELKPYAIQHSRFQGVETGDAASLSDWPSGFGGRPSRRSVWHNPRSSGCRFCDASLRGCEKIGTGTFVTTDFPRFSWFSLGASPIYSQPQRVPASQIFGLGSGESRKRAGSEPFSHLAI